MILVVGESIVDLVEAPDGARTPHAGGSPANVAVGLGRLGFEVTVATQLGDDDYGALMLRHFTESGVVVAGEPMTEAPTSSANVHLSIGGEASYTFDFTWSPNPFEIPRDVRLLHTGSLAAMVQPGAELVESVVRELAPKALISYDPNIRPSLLTSRASAARRTELFVATADLVKVSQGDLQWLYPDRRPESVAYDWLASGAGIVIVTSRSRGWRAFARGGTIGEAAGARKVVDTIGAGDAFTAAVIGGLDRHGLLDVRRRDALREVDLVELEDIVALGARAAVLTVGQAGAQPPYRADLWPVRD